MTRIVDSGQIPLQFGLAEEFTFESFHPGNQPLLLPACRALAEGEGEQQIYIWGPRRCGKTHLLTACCHNAVSLDNRIAYVPAGMITEKDSLLGLDELDLVAIDDVEQLPRDGELALFNLINNMRLSKGSIIIASNTTPSKTEFRLIDLVSRLSWGPVFHLERLNDDQIMEAFKQRAVTLGLNLPDDVADYVFYRQVRDLGSLTACLSQLVDAAMVSKRRLTIPFVKDVLGSVNKH